MGHPMPPTSHSAPSIRVVRDDDTASLARIYNHYVVHSTVTFEEEPIDAGEMERRVHEVLESGLPWMVADTAGVVVGYAYASRWKTRVGYRFSAELSVYLAPEASGHGLGRQLYGSVLEQLTTLGIHAAIGGIALPNEACVALHEKLGFVQVAHFRETGKKSGAWIDVGYWERLLQ